MALVNKIDSNVTGIRLAREVSLKTVDGSAVWIPLDHNSFTDFGGEIVKVERNPINASRQKSKSLSVGINASFGLDLDFTLTNHLPFLESFMYAAARNKCQYGVVAGESFSATGSNTYSRATGDFTAGARPFRVGDLVFAEGFALAGANGLKRLTTVASTVLTAAETVGASTPATNEGSLVVVGFQFGSGEVDISVSGNFVTLTRASGSKDFTQFGLIPGECVIFGGDESATRFTSDVNNGNKRVKAVTTTTIVIDKSNSPMVNETGTGKTIQLFFGRVIKNESDPTLITKNTWQAERTLGAPDDAQPTQIQAEYVVGGHGNTLVVRSPAQDKVTTSMAFVGLDTEFRTGVQGVKAGSRPALVESDAINTSSDYRRLRMHVVSSSDESPIPLSKFISTFELTIGNGVTPLTAVAEFGAFDVTLGDFMVSGTVTGYFQDTAAPLAVRNDVNVTFDWAWGKRNKFFSFDLPMVSLGDARPTVTKDQPVTLPLNLMASRGSIIDTAMDHTLLLTLFDYAPTYIAP